MCNFPRMSHPQSRAKKSKFPTPGDSKQDEPWHYTPGSLEGRRGRPPMGIEKMLRMYLLQIWFNLSDPGAENAIYYCSCKFREAR